MLKLCYGKRCTCCKKGPKNGKELKRYVIVLIEESCSDYPGTGVNRVYRETAYG